MDNVEIQCNESGCHNALANIIRNVADWMQETDQEINFELSLEFVKRKKKKNR